MSGKKDTMPRPKRGQAKAGKRTGLRALDVRAEDAAKVKGGLRRAEDPCAGGEISRRR